MAFQRMRTRRYLAAAWRAALHTSSHRHAGLPMTVRELLQNTADIPHGAAVHGWVQSIRRMKNVCFATVADGSTAQAVQVVLEPEMAKGLTIGAAAKITGSWQGSLKGDVQHRELVATDVGVLGASDPATYPLQKKAHSFEYLRSIPHLRSRSSAGRALLLLRSEAIARVSDYFRRHGFLQTHPPSLTASDCEGAGEVFSVGAGDGQFFGGPAYLTVSAQLHLEALAQAAPRVWCLAPTWRAEQSDTARHLSEFYMLEAEVSFVEDVGTVMDVVEGMLRDLVGGIAADEEVSRGLLTRRGGGEGGGDESLDAAALERRWADVTTKPWRRISYGEAVEVLVEAAAAGKASFQFPVAWGANLQSEHEKYLAETVGDGAPVFVTDFPARLKPFYMLANGGEGEEDEGRRTVACFDLLMPQVGEVVGGSLREHRMEALEAAMRRGMGEEGKGQLEWYLELRRWGSVPHGGFGVGFDRLVGYLAGLENIREAVAFPRWHDRCLC